MNDQTILESDDRQLSENWREEMEAETPPSMLPVTQRAAVALNSAAVEREFRALAAESVGITGITDDASYQECHGARMRLVKARTTTTARGKSAREDAQAYAKSVISEEKRLLAIIAPEETRLQRMEEEVDNARERARQAELDRCAAIADAIQALNMIPATIAGKPSADIGKAIMALEADDVSQWAQDQTTAAQVAHGRALAALQQLLAGALAAEQALAREQAQIAQDRADLARLRVEQQARLADEERLQGETHAAIRMAIEAGQAASRAQIEEEQRQERLARQGREESERVRVQAIRDAEESVAAQRREVERQQAELVATDKLINMLLERIKGSKRYAGIEKAITAYLGKQ